MNNDTYSEIIIKSVRIHNTHVLPFYYFIILLVYYLLHPVSQSVELVVCGRVIIGVLGHCC